MKKCCAILDTQQTQKIANIDEKSYDQGYNSDGNLGPFYDTVED